MFKPLQFVTVSMISPFNIFFRPRNCAKKIEASKKQRLCGLITGVGCEIYIRLNLNAILLAR
jgi:hypothetical protein